MDEFNIIKNYFQKLTKNSPSSLFLKDDVFFDKKRKLVVTIDTYIEGYHFINFKNPELVIKKIIRSSISDLICKGVSPKYYFISASGNKKHFTKSNLSKISKSLKDEQDKYQIFLSGGDTVFSKKLSFTITSIGFSNTIVYRNNAKFNDDIYVTGNIGDAYMGLKILKKKIKLNNKLSEYFIKNYYLPQLPYKLVSTINKFSNTSIDISDGLLSDLEKMINIKKFSYEVSLKKIPISKTLLRVLKSKNLSKINFISNGDDYQTIFTAKKSLRNFFKKISKKLNIKITIIGKILNKKAKSSIFDNDNRQIMLKNKGYLHKF